MTTTLLYYPRITIPSGSWLRQAILYWDEVGSIVPVTYDNQFLPNVRYSREIRFLEREGVFRAFNPERIIFESSHMGDLEQELIEILDSSTFHRLLLRNNPKTLNVPIYKDKLSSHIYDILDARSLVEEDNETDFHYFERHAAHIYMGLLAKYLANNDWSETIPSTDNAMYESLSFHGVGNPNRQDYELNCWQLNFSNVLPIPQEGVGLPKILEFRRKRQHELSHFRTTLDDFIKEIKECSSATDVRDAIAQHKRKVERGVTDLQATIDDARLPYITGVFKALFAPATATSILALATQKIAGDLVTDSIQYTAAAGAIVGAVSVADFVVNAHTSRLQKLRESEYSYLYHAKDRHII